MHPKSPRQEKPGSLSKNVVVCISSKYSHLGLLAIGALYLVFSLSSMPHRQRIRVADVRNDADVKRHMKGEQNEKVATLKEPKETSRNDHDNLRPVERAMTEANKETLFNSYMPSLHPVLNPKLASKEHPTNVRYLMGKNENSQAGYLVEGMERSAYLKLVSISQYYNGAESTTLHINKMDSDHPMVWMADFKSLDMNCHVLESLIRHVQQNSEEDLPTALILLDYSGSTERLHCPLIENMIPRNRIRLTRQNIVQNRHWDLNHSWVDAGELAFNDGNQISGGPILFAPHMLRDSFVSGLSLTIKKANQTNIKSPVDLTRTRDIAYFCKRNDYYSFLRNRVRSIVESLTSESSNGREIHTSISMLGEIEHSERNKIQFEYIRQMTCTKIIVLAQRDEWEGSHRLLEALASGAMVIADKILALPTGLKDKESIILYDSEHSLKDVIFYYLDSKNDKQRLSIARKGWEIAMGRHRSWHRLEEIVFGKPLSRVGRHLEKAPGKRKRMIEKEDAKALSL